MSSIMTGMGQRRNACGLHEGPRTIGPPRTDTIPVCGTQPYCGFHDSISRVTCSADREKLHNILGCGLGTDFYDTVEGTKPLASDVRLLCPMKGPFRQRLQFRCKWPLGNANVGSATVVVRGFLIDTRGNEFGRQHPWYRPRGKTSSSEITRDESPVPRSTSGTR